MPRSYAILLAVALLCPAHARAQTGAPERPHKRTTAVAPGMTPGQVRQLLGEPVHVRREGELSYMEYANGCPGCTNDYVVIRDCRVVAARFENPARQMVTTPVPDNAPPPPEECRLAAAEQPLPPVALAPPAPLPPPPAPEPPLVSPVADTAGCPAPVTVSAPGATLPERDLTAYSGRQWRRRLKLERPAERVVAVPGASLSSPTAYGVQMGEGYVGFAYQARTRFTDTDDGAAAIGIGFGDRRTLALEVTATTYSTLRGGGPLETGGIGFKLHHAFNDAWGVAAGWENAIDWGGSDAGNSPFAVATHVVRLHDDPRRAFSAIAASLGVGAGRFRSEDDVVADHSTANVFGSVSVHVVEPLSAIADWNGQDLYAGISVAPVRHVPLLVNAGFADLTRNAGDGPRFVLSAGVGFRWLSPFFW